MRAKLFFFCLSFAVISFFNCNSAFGRNGGAAQQHPIVESCDGCVADAAAIGDLNENMEEECGNIASGTITFPDQSADLAGVKKQLEPIIEGMKANPNCRVVILGNGGGSKYEQQMSWRRVDAIISYLSDGMNISRKRFIFQHSGPGAATTVDYRAAAEGEEGPSTEPPPHPHLSN